MEKHSSFFVRSISDEEKSLQTLTLGGFGGRGNGNCQQGKV
jgi:hypothetical protein